MKEDLQIKIGADLADKEAPEKLSDQRAREFVSRVIGKDTQQQVKSRRIPPFLVWGGSAIAVAASIVIAVMVFRSGEYGNPSQLIEIQSIHSDVAAVDTTLTEATDTVLVYEIVEE